jgi:hypothetical protein
VVVVERFLRGDGAPLLDRVGAELELCPIQVALITCRG